MGLGRVDCTKLQYKVWVESLNTDWLQSYNTELQYKVAIQSLNGRFKYCLITKSQYKVWIPIDYKVTINILSAELAYWLIKNLQ